MVSKIVNIKDVCREIFAGGDAPKSKMALQPTAEYTIPIYSNGEENSGLYGYTDNPRVTAPSITVSARGTIGYTAIRTQPFVPIVRLITLTPIPDIIDIQYLYYAVKNYNFAGSGTSIPQLTVPMIKDYNFPLPPMEEQRRIAALLDKVSDLIAKRRAQLDKLDLLVKARFVEMFEPESQFDAAPLNDSVEEMFIGPFGSSLKNECFVSADKGYCMVYEQKHAIKKTMNVDTRFIDEKKYEELCRFTVKGGDIIVSCRGTIGETYIVPDDAPIGIMHPSIMKIRLKRNVYNRVFFNHLLQSVLKRHETEANGSGVKMAITATALGKECFIKPSMKIQEQFAVFVVQTDKSKLTIQQSLDKLETLKKALMQQYFG